MSQSVLDFKDVMNRIQDDLELLVELLDIFVEDFEVKKTLLKEAIAGNNSGRIRDLAHSLKGASGNISALRLRETFAVMEKEAEAGRIDQAQELFDRAKGQFVELEEVIRQVKDGNLPT